MIRHLIILVVIFIALIFGLSLYLQPDDLVKCGKSPSLSVGCQKVDAIVAISGGDTAARVIKAVSLYNNGWADTLVFSGAAKDKEGPSNAVAMKNIAVDMGVAESVIKLDEYSETTQQNAEYSKTIFEQSNIKSVILVTSAYHQRRAGLEFGKRAGDVRIINHPTSDDKSWSWWWWLTPVGWWLALSELAKIIFFYVTGIF